MLKQFKNGLRLWTFASVAFSMSACGIFWAGGVDEETNTVAGTSEEDNSTDPQTNLPAGNDPDPVTGEPTGIAPGSVDLVDTVVRTDPVYVVPDPSRQDDIPHLEQRTLKLYVINNGSKNASMDLSVKDSVIHIESGANGAFEIKDLPDGTYSFVLKTMGNGSVSETSYFIQRDSTSTYVLGPVPTDLAGNVDADDLIAPPVQTVEMPDVIGCTPSPDPDPIEPEPGCDEPKDTIPTDKGGEKEITVELPHELDYGIVYSWEGSNVPAMESIVEDTLVFAKNLEELTFEVTFKVNSFPESYYYSKNIFGKKGLFNIAITRSACHVIQPALSFFIGNGFEYTSCYDKAVVSSATLEAGKEITVTGVWDGKHVMLYMEGFLIAEQTLTKIGDINYITEDDIIETPFIFGDKDWDISIIDARLGNKAISSADVLYRHYLKGGAQ